MNTRHPSVASTEFTQALALAANGVNVVTTDGPGGRAGLTVSSMCSVCAEPPVVLACVAAENEFCDSVTSNGCLVVNLLSTEQLAIAKVFAGQSGDPEANRFDTGQWQTLNTGSPVLCDSLVSLDCEVSAAYAHGTHMIYVCRVVAVISAEKDALVYCLRQFSHATPL